MTTGPSPACAQAAPAIAAESTEPCGTRLRTEVESADPRGMSEDDPRHGTSRGYRAHRRLGEDACAPCKRAAATAEARYQLNRSRGGSGRISPVGTRRRLQALVALGWNFRTIDHELGYPGKQNFCVHLVSENRDYIYATTATKVAAVYERLSMRFPPETTDTESRNATRARNLARRNGWPPPLAWDNIDDPNERAHGWQRTGLSRADELRDLDEQHVGITEVCTRLRITRQTLEKWCTRNDMTDLYSRLVARESRRYWSNQYAEGGVA